jgi:hypothetical protein
MILVQSIARIDRNGTHAMLSFSLRLDDVYGLACYDMLHRALEKIDG